MKKALKIIGIGLAGLFILAIIISVIPGGEEKLKETNEGLKQTSQELEQRIGEQTRPAEEEKTWEQKLAQLDTNNPEPDGVTVAFFHRELVKLSAMCEQDNEWVSDRIVQGQNSLKKRGFEVTLKEIAQGFDDAVVELPDKTCEEAFATYLTGKATGQL